MKRIIGVIIVLMTNFMYSQGKIEIEVRTNVNSFTCECSEESFISKKLSSGEGKLIAFPVAALSCPKKMIEKDLQDLFKANKYPMIKLAVGDIHTTGPLVTAKIDIQIKDMKKPYELELKKEQESSYLIGQQSICLSDFKIEPPVKAMGLVKVQDEVEISFKIPSGLIMD